jgi:hypothetical protein
MREVRKRGKYTRCVNFFSKEIRCTETIEICLLSE